jgi:hypothetical protein
MHRGAEPWEQLFLEIMPSSVWVLAIKRPEGGQGETIIRLQQLAGRAVQAFLKSAALGLDHNVDLAPWEMRTLPVKPAHGQRAEVREVYSFSNSSAGPSLCGAWSHRIGVRL